MNLSAPLFVLDAFDTLVTYLCLPTKFTTDHRPLQTTTLYCTASLSNRSSFQVQVLMQGQKQTERAAFIQEESSAKEKSLQTQLDRAFSRCKVQELKATESEQIASSDLRKANEALEIEQARAAELARANETLSNEQAIQVCLLESLELTQVC